jgi:hypothetical protein
MALKEKVTPKVKIGPTMEEGGDPPNPAESLRVGPLPTRTFSSQTICRPFMVPVVNSPFWRNDPDDDHDLPEDGHKELDEIDGDELYRGGEDNMPRHPMPGKPKPIEGPQIPGQPGTKQYKSIAMKETK